MERPQNHKIFEVLGQKLVEFRAAIEDRKKGGDTHLSFVNPDDLTLEDAEMYEKLLIDKLTIPEYEQMASEVRVLSRGTTRDNFYQFIGNELYKKQLSKSE